MVIFSFLDMSLIARSSCCCFLISFFSWSISAIWQTPHAKDSSEIMQSSSSIIETWSTYELHKTARLCSPPWDAFHRRPVSLPVLSWISLLFFSGRPTFPSPCLLVWDPNLWPASICQQLLSAMPGRTNLGEANTAAGQQFKAGCWYCWENMAAASFPTACSWLAS